jgi:SAM-dependent methyltransferase
MKKKNLDYVSKIEGDSYYVRRFKFYNSKKNLNNANSRILQVFKLNKLRPKNVLEIGCVNGNNLNLYKKYLGIKKCVGIDLSSKAIEDGNKKFKQIKLLRISSLKINDLKEKFDLIICSFFLYLLDREEIFNQFNLIYKNINPNGHLIIQDFDPLFKHTNDNIHLKNLKSFKMSYNNFLEESGLFKLIFKMPDQDEKKYKFISNKTSISLLQKINFLKTFPKNV